MDAITQGPEIWFLCSTPWCAKNISSFKCFAQHLQPTKDFPTHFLWGSLRNARSITNLTHIGVKSQISVVDAFTVITSHLIGWKVIYFKKKSLVIFLLFFRVNLYILYNYTIRTKYFWIEWVSYWTENIWFCYDGPLLLALGW